MKVESSLPVLEMEKYY